MCSACFYSYYCSPVVNWKCKQQWTNIMNKKYWLKCWKSCTVYDQNPDFISKQISWSFLYALSTLCDTVCTTWSLTAARCSPACVFHAGACLWWVSVRRQRRGSVLLKPLWVGNMIHRPTLRGEMRICNRVLRFLLFTPQTRQTLCVCCVTVLSSAFKTSTCYWRAAGQSQSKWSL